MRITPARGYEPIHPSGATHAWKAGHEAIVTVINVSKKAARFFHLFLEPPSRMPRT